MPKRETNYREVKARDVDSGLQALKRTSELVITLKGSVLALTPNRYFVLNQSGEENPIDSSVNAVSASLNAPYAWGITGPIAGRTSLELSGGYFNTGRLSLPGDQTRVAFVKLTSTKASSTYEGDASLTIMGDTDGEIWDSFGISDGKVNYRRFNNSVWQSFSGATSVNDGFWHMVAMTYDSTTRAVTLYVDGSVDGSGTVAAHQAKGGIIMYGRGYSSADNFVGSLSDLIVLDRVLTLEDFADLWSFI